MCRVAYPESLVGLSVPILCDIINKIKYRAQMHHWYDYIVNSQLVHLVSENCVCFPFGGRVWMSGDSTGEGVCLLGSVPEFVMGIYTLCQPVFNRDCVFLVCAL